MGEIFSALEVLNRTMKLGLTGSQLMRAEAGFKSAMARVSNPDPSLDAAGLAETYELKATWQKRPQRLSLGTLEALATKEISSPTYRVAAPELKKFDKALAASPKVSTREARKIVQGG